MKPSKVDHWSDLPGASGRSVAEALREPRSNASTTSISGDIDAIAQKKPLRILESSLKDNFFHPFAPSARRKTRLSLVGSLGALALALPGAACQPVTDPPTASGSAYGSRPAEVLVFATVLVSLAATWGYLLRGCIAGCLAGARLRRAERQRNDIELGHGPRGQSLYHRGLNVHVEGRDAETIEALRRLVAAGMNVDDVAATKHIKDIRDFTLTCAKSSDTAYAALQASSSEQPELKVWEKALKALDHTDMQLMLEENVTVDAKSICALVWNCIQKMPATEGERVSRQRLFVAQLADNYLFGPYCAQGCAQRLLSVLEGVYQQVQFSPQSLTVGEITAEFGRELANQLEQQPASSREQFMAQQAHRTCFAASLLKADKVFQEEVIQDITAFLKIEYDFLWRREIVAEQGESAAAQPANTHDTQQLTYSWSIE